MENGDKEKENYVFENDQMMLDCASGRVTVNADEVFTYTSAATVQVYQFKTSQAEIDMLKGN